MCRTRVDVAATAKAGLGPQRRLRTRRECWRGGNGVEHHVACVFTAGPRRPRGKGQRGDDGEAGDALLHSRKPTSVSECPDGRVSRSRVACSRLALCATSSGSAIRRLRCFFGRATTVPSRSSASISRIVSLRSLILKRSFSRSSSRTTSATMSSCSSRTCANRSAHSPRVANAAMSNVRVEEDSQDMSRKPHAPVCRVGCTRETAPTRYRSLRMRDASFPHAGAAAVAPVAFLCGTSRPTRATKRGSRSRTLPTKLA
jgi:hypothetical protein